MPNGVVDHSSNSRKHSADKTTAHAAFLGEAGDGAGSEGDGSNGVEGAADDWAGVRCCSDDGILLMCW